MLVLGAKGHTATSPPVGFIPGGLRSECTCGRRMEARGGALALGGGPAMFGGTKAVSALSEVMGANILEMTTCWSCCAEMVLKLLPCKLPGWEFKALPDEMFKFLRIGLFPSPTPNEGVARILPGGPITEGLGIGCELCTLMGCWTGLPTNPNTTGILWAGLLVRELVTTVFKGVVPYKWFGVLRGVHPTKDVWELAWAKGACLSAADVLTGVPSCSRSLGVSLVTVSLGSLSPVSPRLSWRTSSVSRDSLPAFFPFPFFRLQETWQTSCLVECSNKLSWLVLRQFNSGF